jgi:hypothetical protein
MLLVDVHCTLTYQCLINFIKPLLDTKLIEHNLMSEFISVIPIKNFHQSFVSGSLAVLVNLSIPNLKMYTVVKKGLLTLSKTIKMIKKFRSQLFIKSLN